jgi:hypothetical protein
MPHNALLTRIRAEYLEMPGSALDSRTGVTALQGRAIAVSTRARDAR